MSSSYANDLAYQPPRTLQRQPSRWRLRLSRFLRGQRRSKGLNNDPLSPSPPRLAPIGSTGPKVEYGNIAADFASLRFDEKGGLGDFDLSFDTRGDFKGFQQKREVSGGSEREPETKKLAVEVKRPSKSAAGERGSRHISNAPSIDLPRDELDVEKGFFDAWLLNAVQEGKIPDIKDDDKTQTGTVVKRKSVTTRTPIASQFATVGPPIASQFSTTTRPTSIALSTREKPVLVSTGGITGSPTGSKRKMDDEAPTSPSKRGSIIRNGMSSPVSPTTKVEGPAKVDVFPNQPALRQSVDLSQDNIRKECLASKRLSSDLDDVRSMNLSVASKRYSVGSDLGSETTRRTSVTSKCMSIGSAVPAEAYKVEYQRPSVVASLVDSETASTASTSPTLAASTSSLSSAKRFEIKTTSLLTPVTRATADKQAREVSSTISRINNGAMAPPALTPRSISDTHSIKSESERTSKRRVSQPSIRNSYADGSRSGSPVGNSRTPTPEPGQYPEPTARARRPSSRLSDRMSWLRELDEASGKQTGRDFVFRKLEGGVAAKLAAFETKKSGTTGGTQTPNGTGISIGRSRSNSITSRQSSSELYGIESNRLTRRSTTETPGSISNVVNDDFKQKLESMTGNMADKISKGPQPGQSASTNVRGPAAMAAARRKIPQDVLDFIALSGVDAEIAINEYMQQGTLGRTKEWDHDEILRQIETMDIHEPKSSGPNATKEKDAKLEIPAVVVPTMKPAELILVQTKDEAKVEPAIPTPIREEVVSPTTGTLKDGSKTENVEIPTKPEPEAVETQSFNPAALPMFG
jgi:hypothetical protein